MRAFLLESMATLGLVDVAYVRPHGLWPEFSGWWGTDELPYCGRYDGLLYVSRPSTSGSRTGTRASPRPR